MMTKGIKYTLILALATFLMATHVYAQSNVNVDSVYNNNIKTIQTKLLPFGEPSILLINNGNERLTISFDDMNNKAENYGYSLKLCNADWSDNGMSEFDYLDGFIENDIDYYAFSLKTNTNYVYYEIELPNNSVRFKIAGNYLVKVFNLDTKELLFTKRLVVCENYLEITANLTKEVAKTDNWPFQSISVSAEYPNYDINSLTENYSATIVKNNNWAEAVYQIPMNIVGSNRLFSSENGFFSSGNEFRQFDITNLENRGERVQSTLQSFDKHYARLVIDTPRNYTKYQDKHEINGWFEVKNKQKKSYNITSEYIDVTFTLQTNNKLDFGDVYITGLFNSYQAVDAMKYHENIKSYTATLNLKQGTYNYGYGLKTIDGFDPDYFEGNLPETNNEYFVVIYKSDFSKSYDEAIGVAIINPQ